MQLGLLLWQRRNYMGSMDLIAPKGGGRVAYAVERLWEGLRRETTCEQDLERLGILLLCCLRRGLTEMCVVPCG